jgi:hypothetical protein
MPIGRDLSALPVAVAHRGAIRVSGVAIPAIVPITKFGEEVTCKWNSISISAARTRIWHTG